MLGQLFSQLQLSEYDIKCVKFASEFELREKQESGEVIPCFKFIHDGNNYKIPFYPEANLKELIIKGKRILENE